MADNGFSKENFTAEAMARYLDEGAAKEYPNDPEAQAYAANANLYLAVETNLAQSAPKTNECRGFLQAYDQENPYGYCGNDGVKTTDRFLEEIRNLQKPGIGLDLELKRGKPGWSYTYEAVFPKK